VKNKVLAITALVSFLSVSTAFAIENGGFPPLNEGFFNNMQANTEPQMKIPNLDISPDMMKLMESFSNGRDLESVFSGFPEGKLSLPSFGEVDLNSLLSGMDLPDMPNLAGSTLDSLLGDFDFSAFEDLGISFSLLDPKKEGSFPEFSGSLDFFSADLSDILKRFNAGEGSAFESKFENFDWDAAFSDLSSKLGGEEGGGISFATADLLSKMEGVKNNMNSFSVETDSDLEEILAELKDPSVDLPAANEKADVPGPSLETPVETPASQETPAKDVVDKKKEQKKTAPR